MYAAVTSAGHLRGEPASHLLVHRLGIGLRDNQAVCRCSRQRDSKGNHLPSITRSLHIAPILTQHMARQRLYSHAQLLPGYHLTPIQPYGPSTASLTGQKASARGVQGAVQGCTCKRARLLPMSRSLRPVLVGAGAGAPICSSMCEYVTKGLAKTLRRIQACTLTCLKQLHAS